MRTLAQRLQDQLDEITAGTRALVQPERLAVSERAIEDLFASGAEDRILSVGVKCPVFELSDASGRTVRSADLLALGPLVVDFFRGRWDPYCVTELEAWRELYSSVREMGALVIAISPHTIRQNDFAADQHSLPFPLLSDAGCVVAAKFGLVHTLGPALQNYYRSILVNIPSVNGDESWRLPLPATYAIAQDGTVLYAEAHADSRVRPEPSDVLESLRGRKS